MSRINCIRGIMAQRGQDSRPAANCPEVGTARRAVPTSGQFAAGLESWPRWAIMPRMQFIRDIHARKAAMGQPGVSFEFFPPKTPEGERALLEKTIPALKEA